MRKSLFSAMAVTIALSFAATSYAAPPGGNNGGNGGNNGGNSSANAGAAALAGASSSSSNENNILNIAGGGAGGDGGAAWSYSDGGNAKANGGDADSESYSEGGDAFSGSSSGAKAVGKVSVNVQGDVVNYEATKRRAARAFAPDLAAAASPITCGVVTSTSAGGAIPAFSLTGGSSEVHWDMSCVRGNLATKWAIVGNMDKMEYELTQASIWADSVDGLDHGDEPAKVASAKVWNNGPLVGGRPE